MADFSKQYCEKYDPEMPWDFDIDNEFEEMPLSSFKAIICEGFGFFGLHKDVDGKKYCLFGEKWKPVPYEDMTNKTYLKYK